MRLRSSLPTDRGLRAAPDVLKKANNDKWRRIHWNRTNSLNHVRDPSLSILNHPDFNIRGLTPELIERSVPSVVFQN